jgi:predicted nucleotidyltransferase
MRRNRARLAFGPAPGTAYACRVPPDSRIDALRHVLARQSGMRLAILFGSVARGTANEQSDVDLAVDVEPGADLAALASELTIAAGREVDLVRLSDAGVPLLEELVRDGVVVYEVPHAAARWRAHVLADLEIDRPWYARMRDAWLRRVAAQGLGDGQS